MGITAFFRRMLLLLPVMVCFFSPQPVRAEEDRLSVNQVVQFSLQNNGELKSLRDERRIREAGRVRAGLLPNPTLELEGSTGALTGSSAENSLALGMSQTFILGGKRGKRLAIADYDLNVYDWNLADRERLVREEVTIAFHELIQAERRLALADRAIAFNRQLLEVTRERLAAGDVPELELNLVNVELARSEGTRIMGARTLQQCQAKLFTLMGLPIGMQVLLSGSHESTTGVTQTLEDLKQLARSHRPDLKALKAEIARGDAEIVLARSEAIPDLTAGLTFTRDTTSMEIGGAEGKDTAYGIGLKLSIPIPLFDRNQAVVLEAGARRNSTESRLSVLSGNMEREVETAYAIFRTTEKVLSLYTTHIIPQLDENLTLTQEAYRLGEVGILAVIQEQKKFIEVSDSWLTAQHDHQIARVKLESAVASDLSGGVQ